MTNKQRKLLDFILRYQAQNGGASPNYEEMAAGIGLAGKGGIGVLLHGLEREGRITGVGLTRGIQIEGSLTHVSDAELIAEYDRRRLTTRRKIAA